MITREKRALNLGYEGGTKPTQVDATIKVLSITFQCHSVYGGCLKREITLLVGEKGIKDHDHTTDLSS